MIRRKKSSTAQPLKGLNKVTQMNRKTYLQYYIKVLETQIKEASKILKQKKKELTKLK